MATTKAEVRTEAERRRRHKGKQGMKDSVNESAKKPIAVKASKAPRQTPSSHVLSIPSPNIQLLKVRITGTSPLMTHKWDEKAKKMMRDKHGGKAVKPGRAIRVPEDEFEAAKYKMPGKDGRCGFPATGIKAAMVRGADNIPDLPMTKVRGMFFVNGEIVDDIPLVEIKGRCEPVMAEHLVRLNGKSADLRYRPVWNEWHMDLEIQYCAFIVTAEQIVNLLALAGFSVGIGEYRPEKSGTYGMFTPVGGKVGE